MAEPPGSQAAVALMGSPGAGKGTIARRLGAEHGLAHVDMGRLLRARADRGDHLGDRIAIAQARGLMVPTAVVVAVLAEDLERRPPAPLVVLDGFPRTPEQVAALDDRRVPVHLERVLWLDVPDEVAAQRLLRRAAETDGARADDREPVVRRRLDLTVETVDATRAIYERRGLVEVVDATRPADEVYARVSARLLPTFAVA